MSGNLIKCFSFLIALYFLKLCNNGRIGRSTSFHQQKMFPRLVIGFLAADVSGQSICDFVSALS